jgi:hypothetical protein
MARQQVTINGLKLYRAADGAHWLHLGENAAFCVERMTQSEITSEQVRLWFASQVPVSEQE